MQYLIIGDLHFGIKSNAIDWLESQLDFFEKQIFKTLEDNKEIGTVVFLGDMFDIRYSVNQQIAIEVKQIIRVMLDKFKTIKFMFIAGNHDYYSPLEEFAKYNAYNVLFGEEFIKVHPNATIINEEPLFTEDGALYLPWYYTENPDHFDEILYQFDFSNEVKAIFCHTDLSSWPGARISSLHGCPIYSGHIHYIYEDELCNLHNVGAMFPLTFGDVNQSRYMYILEDFKIKDKIKNVTTPKFTRIYDKEIFDAGPETFENSYVQICVSNSNINKAKYVEQIKNLKTTYTNANIRIHVIDDDTNIDTLSVAGFNTNINKYIEDNIPQHLDTKYNVIKQKLQEA